MWRGTEKPMSATAAPPAAARPARVINLGDRSYLGLLTAIGLSIFGVAAVILVVIWHTAQPAVAKFGLGFITGTDWDPVQESFGALPFIYGTLVTSALALMVAVPVSLGLALFVTEMAPKQLRPLVSFALELLAGIPSVVYGLWGMFVLVPWLRQGLEPALARFLGFLPLFKGPPLGMGYLAGGLILTVMILPTITSISIEVIRTVPQALREAALALGATRWEMVRLSILPYCRAGILGAILLGLGRALGETMAVTMVIGNAPEIHASLFSPGYTLPAVIANEFAEASGTLHTAALAYLALLLFGVTLLLNVGARLLVRAAGRGPARVAAQ
jgi:phosphate transport system permease protein